jgi:hypothetical protein
MRNLLNMQNTGLYCNAPMLFEIGTIQFATYNNYMKQVVNTFAIL